MKAMIVAVVRWLLVFSLFWSFGCSLIQTLHTRRQAAAGPCTP